MKSRIPNPRGRPKGKARYRVIAAAIIRRIKQGEWAVGTQIPSSRNLQKIYRVSTKTLLHALQQVKTKGWISFSARKQPVVVRRAPECAVPSDTVVLVFSRPLQSILREEPEWRGAIYRGILEAIKPDWPLLILQGHSWRKRLPETLFTANLRGVLIIGCPFKAEVLKRYEEFRCAVVLVDRPAAGLHIHSIAPDNYKMAFEATSRLIALGHRRIALLRGISDPPRSAEAISLVEPDLNERTAGFEAACRKARLTRNHYCVFTSLSSGEGFLPVFKANPRFTAVIACDLAVAAQITRMAERQGIEIPQSFSVVAFFGSQTRGGWSGPAIDFFEFGRKAVELLSNPPTTLQVIRMAPIWQKGATIGPVHSA